MKLLYLGNEISSLSSSGGYNYIKNFPGADYIDIIDVNKKNWDKGLFFRMINDIIAIKKACKVSANYDVVHSVHEDDYFFPLLFKCKCKSVGTVHVDITGDCSLFKKLTLWYFLKKLDLIIVLSTEQEKKLSSLGYNCKFVPHGYDKPNFNSVSLKDTINDFDESKINIFFSGIMYRDIDMLEKVVSHCSNNANIKFHILSQKGKNRTRFENYENVVLYNRLEDDIFFSLMEKCDYVFIPLIFSTANNSVLEAHCLGKRCIIPNRGGVVDYASPKDIFYSSEDSLYSIFDNLKKEKTNIYQEVIDFSSKFSWNSVYKQLEIVYEKLFEK